MKRSNIIIIVAVVVVLLFFIVSMRSSNRKGSYVSIDIERVLFEMNSFLRETIIDNSGDNELKTNQYFHSVDKTIEAFKVLLPSVSASSFNKFKEVLYVDLNDDEMNGLYNVFGKQNVIEYINAVRQQNENIKDQRYISSVMNFEKSNHHLSQMILNLRKVIS